MKSFKFFALVMALLIATISPVSAKKEKKTAMKMKPEQSNVLVDKKPTNLKPQASEKNMTLTDECRVNLSLFTQHAKVKNYADALDPWQSAYQECPSISKNIYILGEKILEWQMSQAQTDTEKEEIFAKLMKLYDDRILYFGDDAKVPTDDILGQKAVKYNKYKPTEYDVYYPWIKQSINGMKSASDIQNVQLFMVCSYEKYKLDTLFASEYIQNYTTASEILDAKIKDPNSKNPESYEAVKQNIDIMFAASGVADCNKMNEVFLPNIEANKDNAEYLKNAMRLFKRMKCIEQEAYFQAAMYSHKIQPSAESATGLGNMSYTKSDYESAIKYYNEAIQLADNNEDIADNYMRLAQVYNKLKQYSKVRENCKASIEKNPNVSAPYVMLGLAYAQATVSDDPTLAKAKYWAAVDQFIKAKNVETNEESLSQINGLIRSYSSYFPTKEETFMHPDIQDGKSYYVGGWVNESTTVRSK